VQPDERVIAKGEGAADTEEPGQERTGQCPSAWELQLQYRHGGSEHDSR
jgi:hypothetical protein